MDAAPKLVTVPALYSGALQMGTYMQIKQGFEKVQGQMSMVAHRWVEINHLRSVARRLYELEAELAASATGVDGGEAWALRGLSDEEAGRPLIGSSAEPAND